MTLRPEATPTLVSADALIDDALLRALEPTITALERLFEAERRSLDDVGEPDGFDGVDHRGALERLLPHEWQLAVDAPDEFLRRFEQGELAYFRLGFVTESRPRTSLVLFDCGPDQLGRPRLAQLATLVVLARRASAAGAEMRWGALHSHQRYAVGGRSVERLLSARTLQSLRELPIDAFVDECLVVSPLEGPPFATRQLVLRDHGDDVLATLHDRQNGRSRDALLVMPAADDALRLLRDPTGKRTGTPVRARRTPISNLVFDEQGNKLLARVAPNRVAIYPVPNSPKDTPGRIRYAETPSQDGPIVAAGRVRRSVLTVNIISDGTEIVVRRFGGSAKGPTGTYPLRGEPLVDAIDHSHLGRLSWDDGTLGIHLPTCCLTYVAPGAYVVAEADNTLRWRPDSGSVATAEPIDNGWRVRYRDEEFWYRDGPIYGVVAVPERVLDGWDIRGRIIVIEDGGRTLVARGAHGEREVLYSSNEEILDAVMHDRKPIVALRTASGRIVIRSPFGVGPRHEIEPT